MRSILTRTMDSRPLAAARILLGIAALPLVLEWSAPLLRAADPNFLAVPFIEGLPLSTPIVYGLMAAGFISGVMMILGVAARLASALVAATFALVLLLDQQTMSNHLLLMVILTAFIACSECGASWTITNRRGGVQVPYWPAFLIKAQVTTLYAWTAISKINEPYLAGEVLADHLRSWIPLPESLLPAMAVLSIVIEASLAVALWIPRLRFAAFILGAGLHVGILVLLEGTPPLLIFAVIMLSAYVLFLYDSIERRSGYESKLWGKLANTSPPRHSAMQRA